MRNVILVGNLGRTPEPANDTPVSSGVAAPSAPSAEGLREPAALSAEAVLSSTDRDMVARLRKRLRVNRYDLSVELTRDGRTRFIVWNAAWCRHFYLISEVVEFADGLVAKMAHKRTHSPKWVHP